MSPLSASPVSAETESSLRRISWAWAKANDTKDWTLLASICHDELYVCYDNLNMAMKEKWVSKDVFLSMMNSPNLLGNPEVSTQHLLGNVCFEKTFLGDQVNVDVVCGEWQITASHRRTPADGDVKYCAAHGYVKHYYKQVEGIWKLAGVEPSMLMESLGSMKDIFNH